jgi:putative FmdB family regulatory protein
MPIYEYRCSVCGYQNDYLQKISEPPLTECPECGKSTFTKQVTAAGFQLKGTGWYATDFRNNGTASAGAKKDGKGEPAGSGKGDAAAGSGKSEGAAASGATESASSSTGAAASGAGTSSTST